MRSLLHAAAAAVVGVVSLSAQGNLTVTTTTLTQGVVGRPYNQVLVASGGLRPYTWTPTGTTPPGITLAADGTLSGVPTTAGLFSFEVKLTDGRLSAVTRTLALAVAENANGLAVITTTLPAGVAGQSYSQTLQASGGVPPYRWIRGFGFPAFLTLDEVSGRISGTSVVNGVFTFGVVVSDAINTSATVTLTLTLRAGAGVLAITTPAAIFEGSPGTPYLQAFRASGGLPPYKWSILSGNTGGLTLNPDTGDLVGTPERVGTFAFVVQVTDSLQSTASQSYSLVVSTAPLSVTVAGSLPAGTTGVSYSQRVPITVSGGRSPYTWSLPAGQATPPGLAFSPSDQMITGTPTSVGTFRFSVQVTDADGVNATRQLSIVINPATLSITTARQFPEGTLNVPYAAAVEGAGGQPPYRWSASGLPSGLVIDAQTGQISGTPAAAGEFPIAVTLIDSALVNIADRFTMTIKLPAAPTLTLSGLPREARSGEQFPIQIAISAPYSAVITGEAILTFAPDAGPIDRTVQFASGGTSAQISIPAGSTSAVSTVPLAVQTGTVAGTITVSVRLQAGGIDITTSPAPAMTTRIERAAPVVSGVRVSRSTGGLTLAVSGYSTAREVTQVTFTFKAATGQSLQAAAASIPIPVDALFGPWFQDPANSVFGSQFLYTQPFTIQGDPNAVLPDTVTVTNRLGSSTFTVPQ